MGNSNRKRENSSISVQKTNHVNRERFHHYFSQLSLSNIANNLSGRSFLSVGSHQSNYSVSRPWSRISRRRWKESTLNEPFEASKTAWPVANIEAAFLPEFTINTELTERNFRILELISHGAYGKVYKVQKLDTHQLYALKILSKAQVIHENAVRQVKEEVAIQKVCGHNPFIVGCPFHWQSHRRLYIVSEYVDGGELFHLLEHYGPLPEYLVAVYVAEIALALDFLHNAGIVYRDLKPENILLDQADYHIHLIDFGLSKWLKYGDRTTTLCGTLRYMGTELASFLECFTFLLIKILTKKAKNLPGTKKIFKIV